MSAATRIRINGMLTRKGDRSGAEYMFCVIPKRIVLNRGDRLVILRNFHRTEGQPEWTAYAQPAEMSANAEPGRFANRDPGELAEAKADTLADDLPPDMLAAG
jgi:hypothetical protein